jgi:hypothetical protein
LIHQYFPIFDLESNAARVAAKENTTPDVIKARWKQSGDRASEYGTRAHEMAEWAMKNDERRHTPRDERESLVFSSVLNVVKQLQAKYQLVAVEKIVFSERVRIAGTIDLLMSDGLKLIIFDYKTNAKIRRKNNWGKAGLKPIGHLPDCEFSHYALQLSMAEKIMRLDDYIENDVLVDRHLIHVQHDGRIEMIATPDMTSEVTSIMLYNATKGFDEVPF